MRFYLDNLLSKWGFSDGDILDDLLQDNNFRDVCQRDLLIKVIKEKVIPKVEDDITLNVIGTIHNPIRAGLVNGQVVNWFEENDIKFKTEYVDVDDKEILSLINNGELNESN